MGISNFIIASITVVTISAVPATSSAYSAVCTTSPGGKVTVDGVVHQMPDIMQCDFYNDYGGHIGPIEWNYGGGGGGGGGNVTVSDIPADTSPVDKTPRDIDGKLECAIENSLPDELGSGRAAAKKIKYVDVYAFHKDTPDGAIYAFSNSNTPPTAPGWQYTGGVAYPGAAYAEIFKGAAIGNTLNRSGSRPGKSTLHLNRSLGSLEMKLFLSVHEYAHLKLNANESAADWYAISALNRYVREGKSICDGGDGKGGGK